MNRITWEEVYIKNAKYPLYNAYNSQNELLGHLEKLRVGRFMHWCWIQEANISMSAGCLDEVRNKQKEALRLEKSNNPTE